MNFRDIITSLFDKGKIAGFSDMEVYISRNKKLDLRVFNEEIDSYSIAEDQGLSFRGLFNGKMGYSYTEKIDESSVKLLVNEAIENAKVIDSEDEEYIFEGSKEYKEVNCYNDELENVPNEKKIKFAIDLEKEAKTQHEKVKAVNYCLYSEGYNHSILANTKGLDLEDKSNLAFTYVSVMVKDGDDVKTAGKYTVSNDFLKFDARKLAGEAVEEAVSMLGAETIESKSYPVILRNNVSAEILEAFSSIFSAENVQKDLSLLKGKLNEKVAVENITLIDDPFMENGVSSRSFDGEGVATEYKKVVDKGVLKTYLYNMKSAKKDNKKSTGNAHKPSYKSSIGTAPSNMYFENGNTSYDDMLKSLHDGILIIDVAGLHSGLNPVSGDFSLSAHGYYIKDGKIDRPVNQITIAGNYFDLLNNIETIGDDLKFTLPSGGYFGSPSLKIASLNISGK